MPTIVNRKHVLLIVPVHNRMNEILCLLSGLRKLNLGDLSMSVVLVDDSSTPPIRHEIEQNFEDLDIIVLRNAEPRGPGAARNQGARTMDSDYIWFLDSDTEIIETNCLRCMVGILESEPGTGAAGGIVENVEGGSRMLLQMEIPWNYTFLYRPFDPKSYPKTYVDGIASANMILRRKDFDALGGFVETWPCYEDNDICLGLRGKGYKLCQSRKTAVLHKLSRTGRESGTFAHFTDSRRFLKDIMETRMKIFGRHAPWLLPILPFLDLFFVPLIFSRIWRGQYATKRFKMAVPKSRFLLSRFLIANYIRCYFRGCALSISRLLHGPLTDKQRLYNEEPDPQESIVP